MSPAELWSITKPILTMRLMTRLMHAPAVVGKR